MKTSVQFPFKVFTFGLLVALVLPRLMQDGMFTDGVLYAAVAHNLAKGLGSFWHPYFNETMFPFFHQQPPLSFGLQAVFFKLFGDSIYVERAYSFLTLLISAWLIGRLWKCIYSENEKVKKLSWLPVIFWIIIPVCLWAYCNNMEENTMGIFALMSVLFALRAVKAQKLPILFLIMSGLCSVLAFLCKGFPGLFAVCVPFFYWLSFRSYRFGRTLLYSIILLIIIAGSFALLFLIPTVRDSLLAYLNDRVLNSIKNVSTGDGRLYLVKRLFSLELISPLALCVIILSILKFKSVHIREVVRNYKGTILLFILIGLSASLPLIITLEQRGFYLVPSFPYYAIAISSVVAEGVSTLIDRINIHSKGFIWFRIISASFLIGCVVYSISNIGTVGQNPEQLHDVYILGKEIPHGETIEVFPATWQDWALHNYFVRHFNISLSYDTNGNCTYFLVEKNLNKTPPKNYSKMVLNTMEYDLYKRAH